MVSLMNQGGYDLVTASGDASLRLIAGGKVQPIDITRIPSFSSVDPRLQNAPWHTVDGKHYGVPYQWGPNVLMYNTKVFKTAPTSWSVVFEAQKFPDGKPNKGRVQAFDGPIYIADAALYLMTKQARTGHHRSVRAQRRRSTRRRSTSCARRSRWSIATGMTPPCRWATSRTKASPPPDPGPTRSMRSSWRSSRSLR